MSTNAKPCCICEKALEPASLDGDWATMQPYGGGEIILHFSFGSRKFDRNFGGTRLNGVICDECTERIAERLEDISDA